MYSVNVLHDRKVLSEGRNIQMGFGFLKQLSKYKFETVQPISPCKDYMNDVIYSEATNKPVGVYGLSYEKQSIFKEDGKCYFAINISHSYKNSEADKKNLLKNYKKLQKFMQFFDKKMNVKHLTLINAADAEGIFLVRIDNLWVKSTYLISAYTLLMRLGQFWDGKEDIIKFATESNKIFVQDIYLRNEAMPRIQHILKTKDTVCNFSNLLNDYSVHNTGICAYQILKY